MKIELITPTLSKIITGNSVTALRISRILEELGHSISVNEQYSGAPCDLLIALHALKSFDSIEKFHNQFPDRPLVVILTGTDLYNDIKKNNKAKKSLEIATRLVVLQKMGLAELPEPYLNKTHVIYQSADRAKDRAERPEDEFRVCVIANLRTEKDPLRTAMAVRSLPSSSRINVIHIGRSLNEDMERFALSENQANNRYHWLGELPHEEALGLIGSSHLISITSQIEGSSNVLGEAIASSVPVIASKISGLIGTLGKDYPGYFPVGDTQALKNLLLRAESESAFYEQLRLHCSRLTDLVQPEMERESWQKLILELST
jgi:putative glycosyltransferase (TIGR04348 family)